MSSSGAWSIRMRIMPIRRHERSVINNKTHILVIGDAGEASELFGGRGMAGIRFSRCAGGNDMATMLRQPGRRYDWILVNAASFDGDETDLVQSLRATGFLHTGKDRAGHRKCGVEWLADGRLQMHCCMQNAERKPCTRSQYLPTEADSVVFEYQAPVKRAK